MNTAGTKVPGLERDVYLKLKHALLDAFRSRDELREMVREQLRLPLAVVSTVDDFAACVGDLIEWHEMHNKLSELVEGAIAARPARQDFAEVRELVHRLQGSEGVFEERESQRLLALANTLERLEDQFEELQAQGSEPGLVVEVAGQIREMRRLLRQGFLPLPVPLRIGVGRRYRLNERIAEGGAAWVYKARDMSSGADVAVKVLKHTSDHSEEMVRRFREGARTQLQLCRQEPRAPGIAEVLEIDGEYEGYHYYVMRYYARGDLHRAVTNPDEQRRISRYDAFVVLANVARTLAVVHDRGLVHRDVKPSNILLDADGVAWLTDFDLVATNAYTAIAPARRGTTAFSAPEQLLNGACDARGDVYALGMTAVFVLEGTVPPSDPAWLRAPTLGHLDEQPEELRTVLERAVAFDPKDRYASMREFSDAFERARELVSEGGGNSAPRLYDLLTSVDATQSDREALWEVVGGRHRVVHPEATWRTVARELVIEASLQESLDDLGATVIRRWPDASLRYRQRRIQEVASNPAVERGTLPSDWALIRAMCELPWDQFKEVLRLRLGQFARRPVLELWRIDLGSTRIEGAVAVVAALGPEARGDLVGALHRVGATIREEWPDGAEVSGADVALMLAVLKQGQFLLFRKGDIDENDRSLWRRAMRPHWVEASARACWSELRDDWHGVSASQRRELMRVYDMVFAFARRLTLWVPPIPASHEQIARATLALAHVTRRVFREVCAFLAIPEWSMPDETASQQDRAEAACAFLSTWAGTLERVPVVLAQVLSGDLEIVEDETISALRRDVATYGLAPEVGSRALALATLSPDRSTARALRMIAEVAGALAGTREGTIVGSDAAQPAERRSRHEEIMMRKVVLERLPSIEFDHLAEELGIPLGTIGGPAAQQATRAYDLLNEIVRRGRWPALIEQVSARYPDRFTDYLKEIEVHEHTE